MSYISLCSMYLLQSSFPTLLTLLVIAGHSCHVLCCTYSLCWHTHTLIIFTVMISPPLHKKVFDANLISSVNNVYSAQRVNG